MSVLGAAVLLLSVPASSGAWAHRPARHARTWYVQAAARAGGNGSRRAPFLSLVAVQRASRPGDRIVVLRSPMSTPPLDGGIALKPRQTLVGSGPSVLRSKAAALPRIENTQRARQNGDAVKLANGDRVDNLVIGPSYRGGIYGRDVRGVVVAGTDLRLRPGQTGGRRSCSTRRIRRRVR
ncbi:MAG: hypothetical protein ACYC91_17345 [Solirubrobacteraceae bacterium]